MRRPREFDLDHDDFTDGDGGTSLGITDGTLRTLDARLRALRDGPSAPPLTIDEIDRLLGVVDALRRLRDAPLADPIDADPDAS